jgi:hypothetical protein
MFNPRYSRYLVAYSVLPALFFFVATLEAAECFSPVPGLQQGERYVHQPIVATRLSNAENNILSKLLGSLDGNWQGEAEETLCLGDIDTARKRIKSYAMQAEVDMNSSGGLQIRANLVSIENRTSREESYRLFLGDDRLSASGSGSKGDVELIELYPDSVSFVQSHILRGNIPQEVLTKITYSGQEFRIVRYFYNHGHLSSISRWILSN